MTATKLQERFLKIRTKALAVLAVGVAVLGGQTFVGGAAAEAASGCVAYNYSQGGNGTCVKYIQQIVNASAVTGYISTDGSFGPATKAAVIAFQRNRGITADGIVGPTTWKNLCSVTQSAASTPKYYAGCDSIRGWTRVFTHSTMNISACNTGSYNRLRFELGSSQVSVSSASVGGLAINTGLSTSKTSAVAQANWSNGSKSVSAYTGGRWVYLGTVSLYRANYAPC